VADRRVVRLHLDHVPVIDERGERCDWQRMIADGLDLGFDSVMIDGSRLPFDENAEATRAVVDMAHVRGIAVEAELGAVLGHEAGLLPPYEELFASGRGFTDVSEARAFVERTGTDWLSVAVGNIHGAISGAAKDEAKVRARLNIDHLRRLHEATGVPLVLHGGSGIQPDCLRDGIRNGIAKINIGTDIRQAYERALRGPAGCIQSAQDAVAERIHELVTDDFRMRNSIPALDPPTP
jgi:ketose-bisphosphate aldolase